MRIKLTSIMVDDQDKALRFYTEVLGFRKKHDIPVGEFRWITVTSPEGRDDLELALEPNANPAGKAFQEAMFAQGIPLAAFEVTDIAREYTRLGGAGRYLRESDSAVPNRRGVRQQSTPLGSGRGAPGASGPKDLLSTSRI
jgi:catechol 2,3-dioxygenase-like lactoylglutathione lyase family enzyme